MRRLPSVAPWLVRTYTRASTRIGRNRVGPLGVEAIRAAACQAAGIDPPAADPDLDPVLEAIVQYVNRDPDLSPLGRRMVESQLKDSLSLRLRISALTDIQSPIAPALFIVGPARTGTTLLQRLLASDPQARSPQLWELNVPIPQPRAASYSADPRIDQTRQQLRMWRMLSPAIFEMHPMEASSPEEDNPILQRGFLAVTFLGALGSNREFEAWVRDNGDANAEGAYRYHRRELSYLQSDFAPTHWVLKSPTHVFGLQALLNTYPDAWVLNTYREPADWLASLCQLHYAFRSTVSRISRASVGAEVLRWWGPAVDRMLELRDEHPDRFVDVDFREVVTAPIDAIRRIYERAGLEYDDVSERRMRDHLARDQFLKEKAYTTALEQFGLDRAGVDDRFARYRAVYGLSA